MTTEHPDPASVAGELRADLERLERLRPQLTGLPTMADPTFDPDQMERFIEAGLEAHRQGQARLDRLMDVLIEYRVVLRCFALMEGHKPVEPTRQ